MFNFSNPSIRGAAILAISITVGSVALLSSRSILVVAQTAQTTFPDTQNYWAQPLIAALAERNIVTGYPDGTYRPEQSVDRDEFASILQAAFNQPTERRIESGSVYKDIPQGYWAETQIKSAYQKGFMAGYPGGYFRPRQPVTKVEALVSLAKNLNLSQNVPSSNQAATAPVPQTQAPASNQAAAQPAPQRRANRRLMLPLAGVILLQPFFAPRVAATTPANQPAAAPAPSPNTAQSTRTEATNAPTPQRPASVLVDQYYDDANRIPQYAVGAVAQATRAGIVANYPNIRQLNPQQPATRGEIAAIIYQTLANQGRVPALANTANASHYIVNAPNVSANNQAK